MASKNEPSPGPAVLRIAPGLELPLDGMTQTYAVLAKKRKGKTFLMRRLVEELVRVSCPVAIIDPVGNWWGITVAADGKGKGLPFVVFGGQHGQLPLKPSSGKLIGDLVSSSAVNVVIDVSGFRQDDCYEFLDAYSWAVMQGAQKHGLVRMHVFDEMQKLASQSRGKMPASFEDIVRLGGNHGQGAMMASQRAQSVDKDVLTQAEMLFAGHMMWPDDRKMVASWMAAHGVKQKDLIDELPKLKTGDFFCWSPSWLELNLKIHAYPIATLDTMRTPKMGEQRLPAGVGASLSASELDALAKQLEERDKELFETDPKRLQARVAELERELAEVDQFRDVLELTKAELRVVREQLEERDEEGGETSGRLRELEELLLTTRSRFLGFGEASATAMREMAQALDRFVIQAGETRLKNPSSRVAADQITKDRFLRVYEAQGSVSPEEAQTAVVVRQAHERPAEVFNGVGSGGSGTVFNPGDPRLRLPASKRSGDGPEGGTGAQPPERPHRSKNGAPVQGRENGELGAAEQAILGALQQWAPLTVLRLAVLTGYRRTGYFSKAIATLRRLELVDGRGVLTVTAKGLKVKVPRLERGPKLYGAWQSQLGAVECSVLQWLVSEPERSFSVSELGNLAGYRQTGYFSKGLARLRSLGLMVGRGTVRFNPELKGDLTL